MADFLASLFRQPAAKGNNPNGGAGGNPANPNGNNQNSPNAGGQGQNANADGNNMNQNGGANLNGGGNNGNTGSQGEKGPMDKFSKMWDNPSSEGDTPPAFALDRKTLSEVASSQDFMKGLDPELIKRATGGDVNSLMEIIHGASRNAYATSLEHAGLLTDKFVGAREAHSSKGLGKNVRKELTTHALSAVPNFKNPVIQKQLSSTADRLQGMHPDASPQEIAQMTLEYFQELSAAIQDPSVATNSKKGAEKDGPRGEEYWDKYFDAANQQESTN